jgi:outer membrane protein with beta-barrel domain
VRIGLANKMKKSILLIAVMVYGISSSYAQITNIDFTIGPNVSFARGSDLNKNFWNSKISFTGGIGTGHSIGNHSAINIKILYESRDFINTDKITYTDTDNIEQIADSKIVLKIGYLNIPLLYGYRFGKRIKFIAEIGPYIGIYLYDKLNVEVEGLSNVQAAQLNSKSTDFGISASISAYYPVSDNLRLKAGLQNYLGLADISGDFFTTAGVLKSNTLSLQLGISLSLNSKEGL